MAWAVDVVALRVGWLIARVPRDGKASARMAWQHSNPTRTFRAIVASTMAGAGLVANARFGTPVHDPTVLVRLSYTRGGARLVEARRLATLERSFPIAGTTAVE